MRSHARPRLGGHLGGLLTAIALIAAPDPLRAQASPPPSHFELVSLRSGNHANPTPVDGVVYRDFITLPAATPWLRLYFARTWLSAGSYLRIVSLRDGDFMTMHQEHLEQWGHSSAYFNGNAVMIELVAGPGTAKNYVEIDKVMAGDATAETRPPETICGPTDDRLPTADPRVGRLDPVGCTAWIIDVPALGNERCHLSAGHCFAFGQVLEFDVPASNANCALMHPPVARQFAVDSLSSRHVDGGPGNDYWVFRCFPNPTTGLSSFETQGFASWLAGSMPALGTALRLMGYGVDGTDTNAAAGSSSCGCIPANGTGTRNQVLQRMSGPLTGLSGTAAHYQVDTCGGNSGSPVYDHTGSVAYAIHTHGGCGNPGAGTFNQGTAITHPGLQAAISAVSAGAGVPGTSYTNAIVCAGTAAGFLNGPFHNHTISVMAPFTILSTSVTNFAWFRYRTFIRRPEALYGFDTCSPTRNFDTVLEVFSEDAGSLTLIGDNDDACGQGSSVWVDLQPETTYYIRVGGMNGQTGDFDLRVTAPFDSNDECADALPLRLGTNGPFDSSSATSSTQPWPCGGAGNDVWFRYSVPVAHLELTFTTCDSGTLFDTVLEVLQGGCGALTSIGCNDDLGPAACSNGQASLVTVHDAPVGVLYVRVGGRNGGQGSFRLNVSQAPPNDECQTAIAVGHGVSGPYSTVGASSSAVPWPCVAAGSDIWFRYTSVCNGQLAITTCTGARTFDTTLEVFAGGCGALMSLGCNDDAGGACSNGSVLNLGVVANQTYWIRLGGFAAVQGLAELSIACVPFADECAGAVPVVDGRNGPFSTLQATTSLPPWPCGAGGNDVWFVYTAHCSAPHTFRTCTPIRSFDTTLEVCAGSCAALISLGCNDDGCDGLGSQLTVWLDDRQSYRIRVGGFAGATGNFELAVEPGTSNGSIVTTPNGCGSTTVLVTGEPRIGGTLTTTLGAVIGVPFIGLGFGSGLPFCGCTVGHSWSTAVFGTTHTVVVPCDPAYLGAPLKIQGADLFGSGGCPNPAVTFTATVTATIG